MKQAQELHHIDALTKNLFFVFLILLCIVPLIVVLVRGNESPLNSRTNYNVQRAQNIGKLSNDIRNYYLTAHALPYSLSDLISKSYFYDPQTGNEYTYYHNTLVTYELCYQQLYADERPDSIFSIVFPPFHALDDSYSRQHCNSYSVGTPTAQY